jgi:hypothetical protein
VAGRPTKYTPAIGQQICKLVAAGVTVEVAAQSQGIGKRTVFDWRTRGEKGEEPYDWFAAELDKSLAMIEARLTTAITVRSKTDWRAAAWYLERRRAERFAEQGSLDRKLQSEYVRMLDAAKRTLDPQSYQAFVAALSAEDGEE